MSGRTPGRLHVLTDETVQSRFSHVELADAAIEGGADVVQFREKRSWSTDARVEVAREIARRVGLHGARAILVVNDRIDVALESGAAGVHLGAADPSPESAREALGREAWIGGTVNDLEQARGLAPTGLDYLGVGPVFGTSSKSGAAPALGLDGLRRIVRATSLPVIAIGNLTPGRVASVLRTGAHGVAVLSDVVCHPDPVARVREFAAALRAQEARVGR